MAALTVSSASFMSVRPSRLAKLVRPRSQPRVFLRRPPSEGALMLIISSVGVFEVEADLVATVDDLMQEVLEMGLHEGIPENRVRLRTGPHVTLTSEDLLGRLLPTQGAHSPVTTIFVQAKLNLSEEDGGGAHAENKPGETLEGDEVVERCLGEIFQRPIAALLVISYIVWIILGCHCVGCHERLRQARKQWTRAMSILERGVPPEDDDIDSDEPDDELWYSIYEIELSTVVAPTSSGRPELQIDRAQQPRAELLA